MTDYPFKVEIVVDPDNPMNVVQNGAVFLYHPSDEAGTSPITLKDLSGLPLPNPLTSNAVGAAGPFVATIPQVKWKSGPWEGTFESFDGVLQEAKAARDAAEIAQAAAVTASTDATAATEAALAGAVSNATEAALDAASAQESALAAQESAAASAAASAGAAGGAAIREDPANPGFYFVAAGGQLTADPTHPGFFTVTGA